jgi:hypothetical protein
VVVVARANESRSVNFIVGRLFFRKCNEALCVCMCGEGRGRFRNEGEREVQE